jgi:hypothetical protein
MTLFCCKKEILHVRRQCFCKDLVVHQILHVRRQCFCKDLVVHLQEQALRLPCGNVRSSVSFETNQVLDNHAGNKH